LRTLIDSQFISKPDYSKARKVNYWMMIQIRDILICSLLLLHFSKSSVISLKSEVTSCKKEGEKIVVDGVTNNPCLVCVCQNLLVDCRIKHCDHVTCYNQFQSKEECCTKCQGCDVNGVHFEPSPTWTTTERCQALNCNDGIVTRTVEQCFLPCKDKLEPLPGQCCPRCKNCVLDNGKILEEQQSYSLSDQPCIKCVCQVRIKNNQICCFYNTWFRKGA